MVLGIMMTGILLHWWKYQDESGVVELTPLLELVSTLSCVLRKGIWPTESIFTLSSIVSSRVLYSEKNIHLCIHSHKCKTRKSKYKKRICGYFIILSCYFDPKHSLFTYVDSLLNFLDSLRDKIILFTCWIQLQIFSPPEVVYGVM